MERNHRKKGNKESEKRVIKCTTDKSTNMKKIIRVPNLKKTMFSTFFHMYNTIKVRLSVDLFVRLNHQKIDCSFFCCFTFYIISFSCGIRVCLNYLHISVFYLPLGKFSRCFSKFKWSQRSIAVPNKCLYRFLMVFTRYSLRLLQRQLRLYLRNGSR